MKQSFLIVDDHPIFRDGLTNALSMMPSRPDIIAVASVAQARDEISERDFDLAFIDMMMPDETGLSLLRYLDDSNVLLPAIAISGDYDLGVVNAALQAGALGFIPKSFDTVDLLRAVRSVLAGNIFLPEELRRRLTWVGDSALPHAAVELGITPKQYAVLQLMSEGLGNREIAEVLNLTENTVKTHSRGLFANLSVHNRTACVTRAQSLDLISPRLHGERSLDRKS